MTRKQFLKELTRHLNSLSQTERQEILQDFKEHFAIGIEKGETEHEIAASLGSPQQIAQEILANYSLEETGQIKNHNKQESSRTIMLTIMLIIFNLIIVLGPFIGIVSTIFSGWLMGGVFIISPLFYLLKVMFIPEQAYLFELFMTIGLVGLGILIVIAMYYITRFSIQLTVKYVQFNIRVAKGEN